MFLATAFRSHGWCENSPLGGVIFFWCRFWRRFWAHVWRRFWAHVWSSRVLVCSCLCVSFHHLVVPGPWALLAIVGCMFVFVCDFRFPPLRVVHVLALFVVEDIDIGDWAIDITSFRDSRLCLAMLFVPCLLPILMLSVASSVHVKLSVAFLSGCCECCRWMLHSSWPWLDCLVVLAIPSSSVPLPSPSLGNHLHCHCHHMVSFAPCHRRRPIIYHCHHRKHHCHHRCHCRCHRRPPLQFPAVSSSMGLLSRSAFALGVECSSCYDAAKVSLLS